MPAYPWLIITLLESLLALPLDLDMIYFFYLNNFIHLLMHYVHIVFSWKKEQGIRITLLPFFDVKNKGPLHPRS